MADGGVGAGEEADYGGDEGKMNTGILTAESAEAGADKAKSPLWIRQQRGKCFGLRINGIFNHWVIKSKSGWWQIDSPDQAGVVYGCFKSARKAIVAVEQRLNITAEKPFWKSHPTWNGGAS